MDGFLLPPPTVEMNGVRVDDFLPPSRTVRVALNGVHVDDCPPAPAYVQYEWR